MAENEKQCPVHENERRCTNTVDPDCEIMGQSGMGRQLEQFTAKICRKHYDELENYRTGKKPTDSGTETLRN
jgi:hypothetical protein